MSSNLLRLYSIHRVRLHAIFRHQPRRLSFLAMQWIFHVVLNVGPSPLSSTTRSFIGLDTIYSNRDASWKAGQISLPRFHAYQIRAE